MVFFPQNIISLSENTSLPISLKKFLVELRLTQQQENSYHLISFLVSQLYFLTLVSIHCN